MSHLFFAFRKAEEFSLAAEHCAITPCCGSDCGSALPLYTCSQRAVLLHLAVAEHVLVRCLHILPLRELSKSHQCVHANPPVPSRPTF